MHDTPRTRRQFCSQACQAVSATALAAGLSPLLSSCGGGGGTTGASAVPEIPTVAGTAGGGAVTVTIDAASPLAAVGGAALVQSSAGSFLVAHTGPDTFTALTATCTHQACTITGLSGNSYVCPCHRSRFDQSGRVLNGPASTALRSFATSFAAGVLTIRA